MPFACESAASDSLYTIEHIIVNYTFVPTVALLNVELWVSTIAYCSTISPMYKYFGHALKKSLESFFVGAHGRLDMSTKSCDSKNTGSRPYQKRRCALCNIMLLVQEHGLWCTILEATICRKDTTSPEHEALHVLGQSTN